MNCTTRNKTFGLMTLILGLGLALSACGPGETDDGHDDGHSHGGDAGQHNQATDGSSGDTAGWTNTRQAATENGTFYVTYRPSPDPIPLNEIFSIEIDVYQSAEMEQMVEGADITVDAEMPTHGHGMNTDPTKTKMSEGKFEVEGMKLHMPGDLENKWVMTVEVDNGEDKDTAKFEIIVEK